MKQAFLAFACVALAATPSLNAQSPTCTPSNGLNFICGLQKPEDLVLIPGTGWLIASGTHTTALLLGLTASYFSTRGSMMGLEFWVRFRRPVFADETIQLEWLVVKVTPHDKLGGDVVDLRGRIRGQDGKTALGAKGRVLVTERL